MSKENLFSTKREEKLSGSQMLENAIKRRENQRRNMMALTEARKMSESIQDFTPMFESTNLEVGENIKKNSALESLYYNQGSKNVAKLQLQMRSRLMTEGMEYVKNKVLEEIIYESYWLDDPVKESTVEQIEESIAKTLDYVSENLSSAKSNSQTKFMSNVNKVIESIVKEAVDRLVTEAESSNDAFTEFELNDIEEDKLEDKLCDLGKDEIVEVVKSKVAQVIQDEKEKGKEKAELFDEIDKETADKPEEEENSTENTEETPSEEEPEEDTSKDDSEEDSGSVKEALMFKDNMNYTTSEKRIMMLLENDISTDIFVDPSWGEFKTYISMISKKIQGMIVTGNFCEAISLIDDLDSRLNDVPENVPTDVKEFVLTMVSTIYGAVPSDEIIISRLGGLGSPELSNNVDIITTSWLDILVNVKTNLSTIKDYCNDKCCKTPVVVNNVNTSNDSTTTLESMIIMKKNQMLNRNIGNTLFESLMIGNINETNNIVSESSMYDVSDDDIDGAALIESLLQYTVFETLDTLGLYKFRLNDINTIKRDFVRSVTEGKNTPIYGNTDKDTIGVGKDKKGRKAVRINTRKMKQKKNIFGKH